MSECGASLAELRQADNITEKIRYRGSLVTKRCDCKNSNGLDPVCKCTKTAGASKGKASRSAAKVSLPTQPRKIFTQTTPAPILKFKSSAPRMGINLNGDTIPIPARYKFRKFVAPPDSSSHLHWMVRPESPPRPARNTKYHPKFEEVPHHRRTHMMPCNDANVVRSNLMAEATQSPQQPSQVENTNNFHGRETQSGNQQAESSAPPVNPSRGVSYMYKSNRGYDYDQMYNNQSQQEVNVRPPPQGHVQTPAPASHLVQEQVPTSHPVQGTIHTANPVTEPTATSHPIRETFASSQRVQEPLQASLPVHDAMPTPASVSTPTLASHSEPVSTPAHSRPPTPIPAQNNFAQEFEAARIQENVSPLPPKTFSPPTRETPEMVHSQMMAQRDLPPCPDQFYPCSHC